VYFCASSSLIMVVGIIEKSKAALGIAFSTVPGESQLSTNAAFAFYCESAAQRTIRRARIE